MIIFYHNSHLQDFADLWMDHTVTSNGHRREWVWAAITDGVFAHWKTNHPIAGIPEEVENLGYYLILVNSGGLPVGPHQRAVRTLDSIEQLLRWTSPGNLNVYGADMLTSLMKITDVVRKGHQSALNSIVPHCTSTNLAQKQPSNTYPDDVERPVPLRSDS